MPSVTAFGYGMVARGLGDGSYAMVEVLLEDLNSGYSDDKFC